MLKLNIDFFIFYATSIFPIQAPLEDNTDETCSLCTSGISSETTTGQSGCVTETSNNRSL